MSSEAINKARAVRFQNKAKKSRRVRGKNAKVAKFYQDKAKHSEAD